MGLNMFILSTTRSTFTLICLQYDVNCVNTMIAFDGSLTWQQWSLSKVVNYSFNENSVSGGNLPCVNIASSWSRKTNVTRWSFEINVRNESHEIIDFDGERNITSSKSKHHGWNDDSHYQWGLAGTPPLVQSHAKLSTSRTSPSLRRSPVAGCCRSTPQLGQLH